MEFHSSHVCYSGTVVVTSIASTRSWHGALKNSEGSGRTAMRFFSHTQ